MKSNWYRFAKKCNEIYGVELDVDEDRFFVCPTCNEPIYESDWTDNDYWLGRYRKRWYCPICEDLLWDENED